MPSGGKASQTRASTTALALFFLKTHCGCEQGCDSRGRVRRRLPSLRDRALAPRSRSRDECYSGPRAPLSQSLSLIDRTIFILTPLCFTIGINISNLVHRDSINASDRHIQIAVFIVILTHDVTNGKNECS